MIRIQPVFDSALVTIERIDHPADVPHVDPTEEIAPHYSVNLLETEQFSIHRERLEWTVGATELFVTTPGQRHRYVHREREGAPTAVCVAVCFKDQARDEVDGVGWSSQDSVDRS